MADGSDDDKTQEPTDKKLEDARRKGEVPIAPEVRHAAMFLAMLIVVGGTGVHMVSGMLGLFARLWGSADDFRITPEGGQDFAAGIMSAAAMALLPVLGTLFLFALLGGLLQGRPMIAWARVKPRWSKLNPASGFKRMFGKRALVEFLKTLAKLCLVGGIAAALAWPHASGIERLVGADFSDGAATMHAIILGMLRPVAALVAALALFDLVWQRRAFLQRMRMSLKEVRDEHKQNEGDPKVKARIRSIQAQRARNRMMANVPKASVVITNPTHYAVALQYDHGVMAAPIVVAKGVDGIALRIREVAGEHGVPLVENRALARALYAGSEIDRPIPVEYYAAVAEVISYVMRIARGRR